LGSPAGLQPLRLSWTGGNFLLLGH
jgi:hypothetical protein